MQTWRKVLVILSFILGLDGIADAIFVGHSLLPGQLETAWFPPIGFFIVALLIAIEIGLMVLAEKYPIYLYHGYLIFLWCSFIYTVIGMATTILLDYSTVINVIIIVNSVLLRFIYRDERNLE